MTIEQMDVVDFAAIDPETDEVILVICDHLEWTEDDQFNKLHMFLLQEKVNAYLESIEMGGLYRSYPKASGRKIVIRVVAKFPMNGEATKFFEKVRLFVRDAGHRIEFEQPSD